MGPIVGSTGSSWQPTDVLPYPRTRRGGGSGVRGDVPHDHGCVRALGVQVGVGVVFGGAPEMVFRIPEHRPLLVPHTIRVIRATSSGAGWLVMRVLSDRARPIGCCVRVVRRRSAWSRTGQPLTVVLLGSHVIKPGLETVAVRGLSVEERDGCFQVAPVIPQLVGSHCGQRVFRWVYAWGLL